VKTTAGVLLHVFPDPGAAETPIRVSVVELKALFFVRDHAGDAGYNERKHFLKDEHPTARRVEITFRDGEVLVGRTTSGSLSSPRPSAPCASWLRREPGNPSRRRARPSPAASLPCCRAASSAG